MFEAVLLSIAGPVATITMNRPKRRNAFNVQMYNDLIASLKQCEENSEVAAVVLTGSGDYFTSGADIGDMAPSEGDPRDGPVGRFMTALTRFPKLIVAAVNGPAIGIGVTLLPHCDVVYASSTATFWAPFSRIAVVPEFCSSLLFPKIMGFSRANEMLMMAKQFSAEEALSANLISKILPATDLLPFVYKSLESALQYPLAAKSLQIYKSQLIRSPEYHADLTAIYNREMVLLRERFENGDTASAVLKLMEATKPKSKL